MKIAQYGTAIVVLHAITAIGLTACSAPSPSQPLATNTSSNPSIASSTLPSPPPTQGSTSPTPSSVPPTQATTEPLQREAVQVIRDYYSAINRQDYEQAYSAWEGDGTASQQSFEQFKQGFANTTSTAVDVRDPGRLDGAAGSSYIEIPVTVTAMTTNGTRQRFRGSYVLRRVNDVPGSTPEQRRWHLYSASLTQVN